MVPAAASLSVFLSLHLLHVRPFFVVALLPVCAKALAVDKTGIARLIDGHRLRLILAYVKLGLAAADDLLNLRVYHVGGLLHVTQYGVQILRLLAKIAEPRLQVVQRVVLSSFSPFSSFRYFTMPYFWQRTAALISATSSSRP